MQLVIGFSVPIETLDLPAIVKPPVHYIDALLSILLLFELHLNYPVRISIKKSGSYDGADFLKLLLDILLCLIEHFLILYLSQSEHVFQYDNSEPLALCPLVPIQLLVEVLTSQDLVYFVLLFALSGDVLLIFLIEMSPLDFHNIPRFKLPLIEHIKGDSNTLLFGVGYHCVSLRNPIIVSV